MVRAHAGEFEVAGGARCFQMPHFRVNEPVKQAPAYHRSSTYAGAHREIYESRAARTGSNRASRTPPELGECGGIYVGVESNRNTELPGERSGKIGVSPACLRCFGYPSEPRRTDRWIERAETADSERPRRTELLLFASEEIETLPDGFFRSAGSDPCRIEYFVVRMSHSTDKLGPAGLDSCIDITSRHGAKLAGPYRRVKLQSTMSSGWKPSRRRLHGAA